MYNTAINISEICSNTNKSEIYVELTYAPDLGGTDAAEFSVKGAVKNIKKVITCYLNVSGIYKTQCARCLEAAEVKINFDFTAKFKQRDDKTNNDADEYFYDNGVIDLKQPLDEFIQLNLPFKVLCGSNCKGLCPICGADLNKTECEHYEYIY